MLTKNTCIKPFLKWAGGKRQLIHEIVKHVPDSFELYIEPFVGAGAVFLHFQPERLVINDFNSQLIMTYQVIRDHVDELIGLLAEHQAKNSKEYYYHIRSLDRSDDYVTRSPVEKAARLIYLNKTCYNGLYRVNSQGHFNVPYGVYKNPLICEKEVLLAVHQYFLRSDITILNEDFASAVVQASEYTFVYFDPPYHSDDNSVFTGYQAGGFDESQQIRLANVYKELTSRGVKCLLSNSDTRFIRELYKDFRVYTVQANRAINHNPEGRGKVNEVLVRNW